MPVQSSSFELNTQGFTDVKDVTRDVQDILSKSKISDGLLTVFVPGSTAGVTTIEYESGAISDLRSAVERLLPSGIPYAHDTRWGDGNGFAHVRAALLGPSLTVPFSRHKLSLGTWQQIVVVDFDNRPRTRSVCVQVVGE